MFFFTINGIRNEQVRRKNNKIVIGLIRKIQRETGFNLRTCHINKQLHVSVNDLNQCLDYSSQNEDLIRSVGYRLEKMPTPGGDQFCKVFNLDQLYAFLIRSRMPYAAVLASYIARGRQ